MVQEGYALGGAVMAGASLLSLTRKPTIRHLAGSA